MPVPRHSEACSHLARPCDLSDASMPSKAEEIDFSAWSQASLVDCFEPKNGFLRGRGNAGTRKILRSKRYRRTHEAQCGADVKVQFMYLASQTF